MLVENSDIQNILFKWVTTNSREYYRATLGQCHSVPLREWDKWKFLEMLVQKDRQRAVGEYLSIYNKIYSAGWRPNKESANGIADKLMGLYHDIEQNGQLVPVALIEGPPGGNGRLIMSEGHHRAAACYFLGLGLECELVSAKLSLETEWKTRKRNGFVCYQSIFIGDEEIVVGHRNHAIGNDALTRMNLVAREDLSGKRVLNLGSNHGHDSFMAAERGATEVVGVEKDEELVNYALRVGTYYGLNCDFLCWDLEEPFGDGKFDTVFCFSMFDHVNKPSLLKTLTDANAKAIYFEGHWMAKSEAEHRRHYNEVLSRFSKVEHVGQLGPDGERNLYRCEV